MLSAGSGFCSMYNYRSMKNTLLLFLPPVLLAGCASNDTAESSAVKQNEIHQAYFVNWDGDLQRYSASATYRFGGASGTTLHLTAPSEVRFNGEKMNEEKMLFGGATYGFESKNYKENSVFEFTDTDRKKYVNSFTFAPLEFRDNPKLVSPNANLEVALNRDILAGEEIQLLVTDTAGDYSVQVASSPKQNAEVYYDAGSKKLIVTPAFFRTMADVPLHIHLQSSFSDRTLKQATDKGGAISFTYLSREIVVERRENVN